MKKREFNKVIKSICSKTMLLKDKAMDLDKSVQNDLIRFIVRNRGPILIEFLNEDTDMSWLASCGYLYETTGKSGYVFMHTVEHNTK